jgi:type I restriction enzyme R subunit
MFLCATSNAQSKRDQIENLNQIVDSLESTIEVLISESVDQQLSLGAEIKSLSSQIEECERKQRQKQAKLEASVNSVDHLTLENAGLKLKLIALQDSLQVVTNFEELKKKLPGMMELALGHFYGVNRNIEGFEGLSLAQDCINTNEKKDAFAKDYVNLSKIWESLSPDAILNTYQKDYKWLSQVYTSVRPATDDHGRLLWHALGAQTTALIHEYIHVDGIVDDMEEMVLDAEVIDELMNKKDPKKAQKLVRILISRFKGRSGDPIFKALSERLEAVRLRAEQGLISSIEFIKELCQLAKETLEAERNVSAPDERKSATMALTELFLETKTDKTPAVVERIVNDIDEIVKIVRFPGWQTSIAGEREVQKSLRKTLLKYQLHKEEELFEKAYQYIKEYY